MNRSWHSPPFPPRESPHHLSLLPLFTSSPLTTLKLSLDTFPPTRSARSPLHEALRVHSSTRISLATGPNRRSYLPITSSDDLERMARARKEGGQARNEVGERCEGVEEVLGFGILCARRAAREGDGKVAGEMVGFVEGFKAMMVLERD